MCINVAFGILPRRLIYIDVTEPIYICIILRGISLSRFSWRGPGTVFKSNCLSGSYRAVGKIPHSYSGSSPRKAAIYIY